MYKYFLYSEEQIKEKNKVLNKMNKNFVPGVVVVNGVRKKFTQISDKNTIPRFIDVKVVTEGEVEKFVYTKPSSTIMKGN